MTQMQTTAVHQIACPNCGNHSLTLQRFDDRLPRAVCRHCNATYECESDTTDTTPNMRDETTRRIIDGCQQLGLPPMLIREVAPQPDTTPDVPSSTPEPMKARHPQVDDNTPVMTIDLQDNVVHLGLESIAITIHLN